MPSILDPAVDGSDKNNDIRKFIRKHGYKAAAFFGLCASTTTTSMVAQEILVKHLTMPWAVQPQIAILIAIAITYNIVMEITLNLIEQYWLNKIKVYLSLNEREAIKFIILALAAVILISQGYYVLPIGLLLFSASYFINLGLQLKFAETINNLFFTENEYGVVKWLEGYRRFKKEKTSLTQDLTLSEQHLRMINAGCVLSAFYVVAVIGVFAKWVFPLILAFTSLKIVIPLMMVAGLILLAYGIIYGFLSANSWATLAQADTRLKEEHGQGLFSLKALTVFGEKIAAGCDAYVEGIQKNIGYFFHYLFMLFFASDKKIKLQSLLTLIGFIILSAAEIVLLSIKLLHVFIVILIFPVFTAVQNILESGGTTIGNFSDSYGLGQSITYGAFIGYLPFIVQSCVNIILPETSATDPSKPKVHAPDFWASLYNIWLKCLQSTNALANSGLANDGQLPEDRTELVKMSGNVAVSYTAGNVAVNNFNEENQKEQEQQKLNAQQNKPTFSSLTQYLWGSTKPATQATPYSQQRPSLSAAY